MSFAQTIISHIFKNANHARIIYITYIRSNMTLSIFMKTQVALIPLLGYGQNIQFDWNINAAEFKNFYPLTHQGSHAFHKNRRKGKRNLPLADRFVKPSKSVLVCSDLQRCCLSEKRPPSTSIHTRTNNKRSFEC